MKSRNINLAKQAISDLFKPCLIFKDNLKEWEGSAGFTFTTEHDFMFISPASIFKANYNKLLKSFDALQSISDNLQNLKSLENKIKRIEYFCNKEKEYMNRARLENDITRYNNHQTRYNKYNAERTSLLNEKNSYTSKIASLSNSL